MVDRLKTTESVSQGARSIRFELDTKDRFCMHQTAKLQYRYYHPSELIFLYVVSSAIQGISRSFNLQFMLHLCPRTLAQPHTGVRSVFFGSYGR